MVGGDTHSPVQVARLRGRSISGPAAYPWRGSSSASSMGTLHPVSPAPMNCTDCSGPTAKRAKRCRSCENRRRREAYDIPNCPSCGATVARPGSKCRPCSYPRRKPGHVPAPAPRCCDCGKKTVSPSKHQVHSLSPIVSTRGGLRKVRHPGSQGCETVRASLRGAGGLDAGTGVELR